MIRNIATWSLWYTMNIGAHEVLVVNVVRRDYAFGLHTVRELNMICRNYVLRRQMSLVIMLLHMVLVFK